jgi:hypothetical protein
MALPFVASQQYPYPAAMIRLVDVTPRENPLELDHDDLRARMLSLLTVGKAPIEESPVHEP